MENLDLILQEYREQIDSIDKEIIYLLSRRMNAVTSIWELKKMHNIPPLQNGRWSAVLEKIHNHSEEFWVNSTFTKDIWERIHTESLRIESNL